MKSLREKVLDLVESLRKEESALILVEGQRDADALRNLGITHAIEKISGKRIFDDLSFLKGKNVIILTDFDRTGRILFRKLRKELEVMGFNPNIHYWQQLKKLLKGEITQIEELFSYVKHIDCARSQVK